MIPDDPIRAAEAILAKFRGKELTRFKRALKTRQNIDWDTHLLRGQSLIRRMRTGVYWKNLGADRKRAIRQRAGALGLDPSEIDEFWNQVAAVLLPFDHAYWESWGEKHQDVTKILRTTGDTDHFQALLEKPVGKAAPSAANQGAYRTTSRARERQEEDDQGPIVPAEDFFRENPAFLASVRKIGTDTEETSEADLCQKKNELRRKIRDEI